MSVDEILVRLVAVAIAIGISLVVPRVWRSVDDGRSSDDDDQGQVRRRPSAFDAFQNTLEKTYLKSERNSGAAFADAVLTGLNQSGPLLWTDMLDAVDEVSDRSARAERDSAEPSEMILQLEPEAKLAAREGFIDRVNQQLQTGDYVSLSLDDGPRVILRRDQVSAFVGAAKHAD